MRFWALAAASPFFCGAGYSDAGALGALLRRSWVLEEEDGRGTMRLATLLMIALPSARSVTGLRVQGRRDEDFCAE